ncbi:glycosyltransferase family 2 protein [Celeribacter marinus]|uniref:glycosyltransferase family 2 protein n=1 Tax=Celeribacter marinus TaxID=1397108 RepID=UPI003F6B9004
MADYVAQTLNAQVFGDIILLDAIVSGDTTDLFFHHTATLSDDVAKTMLDKADAKTVGNAPWITGQTPTRAIALDVDGTQKEITLSHPNADLMRGRNVALATRNGESAKMVLDWLRYHASHQGLTGALIVDRADPSQNATFTQELQDGLAKIDADLAVMHIHATVPLGNATLPPETHPFSTPGAPGKDRMTKPEPNAWSSPLADVLIYELLRRKYLNEARGVANIEVYDLVPKNGTLTMFDLAQTAPNGVVQLLGRQTYPWRIKGDEPAFADHICIQFDETKRRARWCAAPKRLPSGAVFRLVRVGGADAKTGYEFYRCMGLRHRAPSVSKIVPKSSLIEHAPLVELSTRTWGYQPVLMPEETVAAPPRGDNSVAIVTCMKNEGPFILEWLAYHRAIGIEGFLVYTNDCTDGTDTFLDLLQAKGYVHHRDNPFKGTDLKPQHAALQAAEHEDVVTGADWAISMDVDEFINVKVGDGTMSALFAALPDANLISCTWRLFGNADVHGYHDHFLLEQFDRAAPEHANKPHQAWGFKTLFKNIGLFKKFGVHRPKGLKPQIWDKIRWYNGSGKPMPRTEFRNAWRSTSDTYGYDLVQLNHYAVRSAESFLVKRDRGRVNHVDRDQGLAYWFRMNNNFERETSIQRMIPKLRVEYDRLLEDPEIAAQHQACVQAHTAKIAQLRATETYTKFYNELSGPRLEKLSRLHSHFGANVFLKGPQCVPDNVIDQDLDAEFFFTVERGEAAH